MSDRIIIFNFFFIYEVFITEHPREDKYQYIYRGLRSQDVTQAFDDHGQHMTYYVYYVHGVAMFPQRVRNRAGSIFKTIAKTDNSVCNLHIAYVTRFG